MIRTQIYLDEDLYHYIAILAKREKKPKAAVIRAMLKQGIEKEKPKTNAGDALLRLIKLGEKLNLHSDDPELSTHIDDYLYK